jgi:hypothetical protein
VAHEGGHTYGLVHNTTTLTGEDSFTRHLMPAGSAVSQEQRAAYRRHFSDTEFSVLAANVGLSIQTMHNWDLVNPNSTAARRFRLTFLSPQSSPILSWVYENSQSPWVDPVVTSFGTQTFKGTTYNRYRLTWSTGQSWNGGASGQVPAGGDFHVGATFSGVNFNQPDPIIITDSELLDNSGDPLPLKPRLPGYDQGSIDADDGSFSIQLTNFGARRLRIRNVVVRELPRVLSIDAMVAGGRMADPFGQPFRPWPRGTRRIAVPDRAMRRKRGQLTLTLAHMRQRRHVLEQPVCDPGDPPPPPPPPPADPPSEPGGGRDEPPPRRGDPDDAPAGLADSPACTNGVNASLFPATSLFVTADAITPNAKVWNRKRKRFVRRPLKSRIYYQIAGRSPDFDRNGVDDAIDIAFGGAPDRDQDGVPDSAQR